MQRVDRKEVSVSMSASVQREQPFSNADELRAFSVEALLRSERVEPIEYRC
jgi:hypothetical protein